MGRSPMWRIIVSVLLFQAFPCMSAAGEDRAFPVSIEPFFSTGVVYEFSQYTDTYTGKGVLARYAPGRWYVIARYRLDEYKMTYFGISKEAVNQIFSGSPPTVPFLQHVEVNERKTEKELLAGRLVTQNFSAAAGWRVFSLENNFSSMESSGPSARIDTLLGPLRAHVDGAVGLHTKIRNHATEEFVLADGERTLSFYGEPKSVYGWSLVVYPFGGLLSPLSLGYEGSMIVLKYGYRYYHGVTVKAQF